MSDTNTAQTLSTPTHTVESLCISSDAVAGRTRYVLHTSRANMPGSCWGVYARLAILEVDASVGQGHEYMANRMCVPKCSKITIDARNKRVREVYKVWEPLYVGRTDRCELGRYIERADAILEMIEAAIKSARER